MIGGVVAVIVIYLLINVALLSLLPLGDLARSTLPAADAAGILAGPGGHLIITILSLVSLPPMLNAIIMIGTRILFAMGRDGLFWRKTATIGAGGTPTMATLVTTAVAVGRHLTGTFQRSSPSPRSSWPRLLRLLPRADRPAAARARARRVRSARGATRGRQRSWSWAPPRSSSASCWETPRWRQWRRRPPGAPSRPSKVCRTALSIHASRHRSTRTSPNVGSARRE